jgi:hypothetical protein
MDYRPGQFMPSKYPTPELRKIVTEKLQAGVDDTTIAKYLMVDRDVALYSAVRLIQKAKKNLSKLPA